MFLEPNISIEDRLYPHLRTLRTTLPAPGVGKPGAAETTSCSRQNDHSAEHPQVVMQHAFVLENARPRECHAEASRAQRWLR